MVFCCQPQEGYVNSKQADFQVNTCGRGGELYLIVMESQVVSFCLNSSAAASKCHMLFLTIDTLSLMPESFFIKRRVDVYDV